MNRIVTKIEDAMQALRRSTGAKRGGGGAFLLLAAVVALAALPSWAWGQEGVPLPTLTLGIVEAPPPPPGLGDD